MQKYWNTVLDERGSPRERASVAVQQNGTNATIYANQAGSLEKDNPLRTDSRGYFEFYAAPGEYDLVVSGTGFDTYEIEDGALIGLPSDDVSFAQSGTGAVSRTMEEKTQETKSVTDFMSAAEKADAIANLGTVDCTASWQKALNRGGIINVPDGTYLINPIANSEADIGNFPYGVKFIDKTTLRFSPNAKIVLPASMTTTQYAVLAVYNVSDIVIEGRGWIHGDRDTHSGVLGEHGFGIDIRGGQRVTVRDVRSTDHWGDGIYVSGYDGTPSRYVSLDGVICDNNRRNNCSVTFCEHFSTSPSCIFSGANGTAPQHGIDLEPNATEHIRYFNLNHKTKGNYGSGTAVWLGAGAALEYGSINVVSEGDGVDAAATADDAGLVVQANHFAISGAVAHDSGATGVRLYNCDYFAASGIEINLTGFSGLLVDSCTLGTINGPVIRNPDRHGIQLVANTKITINSPIVASASQETTATYDNIFFDNTDESIINNAQFVLAGSSPQARYGINVSNSTSTDNIIQGCRLRSSGITGDYNDVGTRTLWLDNEGANPPITFAAADATPSVKNARYCQTANVGATSITTFDDGKLGQEIYVRIDTNTTLVHGSNLVNASGANITGDANDVVHYLCLNGTRWVQVQ